jgi:hypothetical protein
MGDRAPPWSTGSWVNGLADWTEGDTAFLSVAFTWKLDDAYQRACWYRAQGLSRPRRRPGHLHAQALSCRRRRDRRRDPRRGRRPPQSHGDLRQPGLSGRMLVLHRAQDGRPGIHAACRTSSCRARSLRQQPVGAAADFQEHIVGRYEAAGVPLLDANSGFEPRTFDDEVFARWTPHQPRPMAFRLRRPGRAAARRAVMRMLDQGGTYPLGAGRSTR